MKRLVLIVTAITLLLTFAACGKDAPAATNAPEGTYITEGYIAEQPTQPATEPETPEQILAARRDAVEKEMRRMSSVLWTPAEPITYHMATKSPGIDAARQEDPKHVITFTPAISTRAFHIPTAAAAATAGFPTQPPGTKTVSIPCPA